jgi:hypothetical protein
LFSVSQAQLARMISAWLDSANRSIELQQVLTLIRRLRIHEI